MRRVFRAAVVAAAAALLFVLALQWRPFEVSGRVRLESFDGAVSVPGETTVRLVPRATFLAHARHELDALPSLVAAADEAAVRAREEWSRKARRRDDAAKILRVAEGANSSDLESCRAAYERSSQDAEAAYAAMEKRAMDREALEDTAFILDDFSDNSPAQKIDTDGRFRMRSWGPRSAFLLLVRATGTGGSALSWLAPADATPAVFDNTNVLTLDALRKLASENTRAGAP
ncbi:MAG: hypothetical protein FGM15_04615 [Chthoniobacterales bacterium]|nr:hypothetical protein [Chthoniobacterales bacterium]